MILADFNSLRFLSKLAADLLACSLDMKARVCSHQCLIDSNAALISRLPELWVLINCAAKRNFSLSPLSSSPQHLNSRIIHLNFEFKFHVAQIIVRHKSRRRKTYSRPWILPSHVKYWIKFHCYWEANWIWSQQLFYWVSGARFGIRE